MRHRSLSLAAAAALLGVGASASQAQRADTLALDLPGAIERALRASDESRLAALGVDVAESRIASARSAVLPQVTLNGSYSQVVRNARAEIVGNVFGQSYNYSTNLTISQPLFQGGQEFYALRAAAHTRDASRADAEEIRAWLQVDVQRAYLGVLLATRIAGIQRGGLALARERLAQVEQLEASGRAARYDVLRSRVEVANIEPLVLQAVSDRRLAEVDLRRLLNVPPDQPLKLTTELDAGSVQAVVAHVASETQAYVNDRAAVRSAELVFRARRAAVGAARGDFLPTVNVFVRTGYLALPASSGFPWGVGRTSTELCPAGSPASRICQNDGWFRDESFGVQVSWPLFDGLRAKSELDLASAQAYIAELQWRQRVEQVEVEIERARAEFDRARAVFDARRTTVGEATETYQLATLRFTRNVGTQLEVSDAQLALLTAQTNEARSVYDVHLAAAELARALGRAIPVPGIGVAARTSFIP